MTLVMISAPIVICEKLSSGGYPMMAYPGTVCPHCGQLLVDHKVVRAEQTLGEVLQNR